MGAQPPEFRNRDFASNANERDSQMNGRVSKLLLRRIPNKRFSCLLWNLPQTRPRGRAKSRQHNYL